jgi:hypothetical protein
MTGYSKSSIVKIEAACRKLQRAIDATCNKPSAAAWLRARSVMRTTGKAFDHLLREEDRISAAAFLLHEEDRLYNSRLVDAVIDEAHAAGRREGIKAAVKIAKTMCVHSTAARIRDLLQTEAQAEAKEKKQ